MKATITCLISILLKMKLQHVFILNLYWHIFVDMHGVEYDKSILKYNSDQIRPMNIWIFPNIDQFLCNRNFYTFLFIWIWYVVGICSSMTLSYLEGASYLPMWPLIRKEGGSRALLGDEDWVRWHEAVCDQFLAFHGLCNWIYYILYFWVYFSPLYLNKSLKPLKQIHMYFF